jgi:glutamate synthase domain-containing protein 3
MIKTVKQACVFNPVINDYRMAEGIENLADLIGDKGDGREFFARNFITQGMEQLFREGMLRLSGKSDQAVFELTQAMGGGKTHMMVALGLLARHAHLRPEVLSSDLNGRIDFGEARIAAFNGRNSPDNYIWGEIATQLGAEEAIKPFWINGPKAVDQRKWKEIIGDKPTLILLDELPPYLQNAATQSFGNGTLADMAVYSLSSLMSAALELPNCAIVVANLSGSYKTQTKALAEAVENLQQETRRQAMTITPVQLAGNEIYRILTKRLIDTPADDRVIADVAEEYAQQIKKAEDGGYIIASSIEQIAEQVRELLASLGLRSLDEAIGRVDLLNTDRAVSHWKTDGLDLTPILQSDSFNPKAPRKHARNQIHEIDEHFDRGLLAQSASALASGERVELSLDIQNTERAVGTMLGHELTKAHGANGLPAGTIDVTLTGSAGQSLGAFMPSGITLRLIGDANDYVGKGLSGGTVIVRTHPDSTFPAEHNVIAGNVVGYGATSGSMFINGLVGERFFVRNSGATAVVEGVGDHALEYMTGGLALILGSTGRNLGAGMSGGIAYVNGLSSELVNPDALASGEIVLEALGGGDREIVRDLLERHVAETDSELAQRLLSGGDETLDGFVKVTPRDYAAVLATRQSAVDAGVDPDGNETWLRIMEVTGG